MADLRFFDDPLPFLAQVDEQLAAQPVLSTVVAGIAHRVANADAEGRPRPEGVPCWFVSVTEGSRVVGAGMRTAKSAPHPLYLMPMPDEAACALADALADRGERPGGANGALPAVELFAARYAERTGADVSVAQRTRLFELGDLTPARTTAGRLRAARPGELAVAKGWYDAFMTDADEQAGRPRGSSFHEAPDEEDLLRRIETGSIWLWVDDDDRPVHLTAASPPSYGVSRIGPVYTPPAERGRGYASAAVAAVSQAILDEGNRACLFTDQANPTSNKIYEALGYRPLVDMANLVVG
jgi:GNAT superfamily N-acetyltransferase